MKSAMMKRGNFHVTHIGVYLCPLKKKLAHFLCTYWTECLQELLHLLNVRVDSPLFCQFLPVVHYAIFAAILI